MSNSHFDLERFRIPADAPPAPPWFAAYTDEQRAAFRAEFGCEPEQYDAREEGERIREEMILEEVFGSGEDD